MAADRLRSARAGPSQASSRAPLSSTMMVADAHATHATRYTPHDIDTDRTVRYSDWAVSEWPGRAAPPAAWWGHGGGADQSKPSRR